VSALVSQRPFLLFLLFLYLLPSLSPPTYQEREQGKKERRGRERNKQKEDEKYIIPLKIHLSRFFMVSLPAYPPPLSHKKEGARKVGEGRGGAATLSMFSYPVDHVSLILLPISRKKGERGRTTGGPPPTTTPSSPLQSRSSSSLAASTKKEKEETKREPRARSACGSEIHPRFVTMVTIRLVSPGKGGGRKGGRRTQPGDPIGHP